MREPLELVRDRLAERGLRSGNGEQFDCCCPGHDDRKASLSVGVGDDGRVLLKCQANCQVEDVVAALGLTLAQLYPSQNGSGDNRRIVATYTYKDADGEPVFRVHRTASKDFWQEHPDGNGGWVKGGCLPRAGCCSGCPGCSRRSRPVGRCSSRRARRMRWRWGGRG
jgi:hypothetical protein